MKKMPRTAMLFLIAAIAICGIPPFNGFISEFMIYIGLYNWLQHATLGSLVVIVFSIVGLVLIGGLAVFCFTKAFGIVFLGNPRKEFTPEVKEVPFIQLAPLYLIAFLIVMIGSFPQLFLHYLARPVGLFTGVQDGAAPPLFDHITAIMQPVAWSAWGVIGLSLVLWGIRRWVTGRDKIKSPISNNLHPISHHKSQFPNPKSTIQNPKYQTSPTWSCGYVAPTPKMQYTAGSFVRSYTKLYKAIFLFSKKEKEIEEIFPSGGHYESHAYDKIEKYLVDKPVEAYQWLMGRFLFLQNGKLQVYILYGIIFILSVICLPLLIGKFSDLFEFFRQL
jgi:hydrogenase-4 component B